MTGAEQVQERIQPYPYVAEEGTAEYRPDLYYRYAELGRLLHDWAAHYPALAAVESIGKSYEGRDLWCMTLTNEATGAHGDKPAYYIDANIHAGEVLGSAVCLYTINHLLTGYGADDFCTRLLDDFTFYIVPRISPDGAEIYLTTPRTMRSSVRPYPDEEEEEGLRRADIDGDGWITMMRLKDPGGPWKVSALDPRIMTRRAPDETGGDYYWVLPEGMLSDYDPAKDGLLGEIKTARPHLGLDTNRNFPVSWEPEARQPGAGAFPLSEPETRAIAEFTRARRNIAGCQHYHTFSAVILRPSSTRPDSDLPKDDLRRFEALGQMGTEATGYPCVSIFHDFAYDPKQPIKGAHLDWDYDHLGLLAFSTELWSITKRAGVEVKDYIKFFRERSEEDDLAMLRWADEHLGDFGFVPWRPFAHPQLGPVEIGGWQFKYTFQNAPGPFLEDECHRNMLFTLRAAAAAPLVHIAEACATALGGGLFRVEAVVENVGFLPTNVTERAREMRAVKPDRVCLQFGAGVERVMGEEEQEIGFLPGRSAQWEALSIFLAYGVPTRRKVEWVVRAGGGSPTVTVVSLSERGGRRERQVALGDE